MARMEGLTLARGNRGLLLLAMLAGLAAAVLVFVALANQGEDGGATVSTGGATVKTVVAAQPIPAGTKIDAGMVKVSDVPESLRVEGAFGDTLPVVGEVTKVAIAANEPITPAKVGPLVEGRGLGGVLQPGMRAIGMQVEEVTAVGGNLLPGDRVDVIAVFDQEGQQQEKRIAVTVLQNIEVLAVAQEAQDPLRAGERDADGDGTNDVATSGQLSEDIKEHPGAVTVTLAMTPQEVQVLAGVQEAAVKVYTSLRSSGDRAPIEIPPFDVDALRPD